MISENADACQNVIGGMFIKVIRITRERNKKTHKTWGLRTYEKSRLIIKHII